jgi:hypothetical protein
LLAEHGGLDGVRQVRALARIDGLISRLDAVTARDGARLRRHGPPTPTQAAAMEIVEPELLPFDPEAAPGSEREPVDEGAPTILASVGEAFTALREIFRRREA